MEKQTKSIQNSETVNLEKYKKQVLNIMKLYHTSDSIDYFTIINDLIELEMEIINLKGKRKSWIEKQIFIYIKMYFDTLITNYDFDFVLLNKRLVSNTKNKNLKKIHSLSLKVYDFVIYILNYKVERDNFTSKRKGHAVELFFSLLGEYNIKDDEKILIEILNSTKKTLLRTFFDEFKLFQRNIDKTFSKEFYSKMYQVEDKNNIY